MGDIEAEAGASNDSMNYQNVVVMRHGDRIDNVEPLWVTTAGRPWDPPLDMAGHIRAYSTGRSLRSLLPFTIHRVFVSPFLRCIQTAGEVISALCAVNDDPSISTRADVEIDPSKIKVSIEYGLCEMMCRQAIRDDVAPKDGVFEFNISELEALLPAGTLDHSVKQVYEKLPEWEEPVIGARTRYANVFKALADKYPSENLLLVTHGEGVGVAVSTFLKDASVYEVDYCAHAHLKRPIHFKENGSFSSENFEVLTHGQTGWIREDGAGSIPRKTTDAVYGRVAPHVVVYKWGSGAVSGRVHQGLVD